MLSGYNDFEYARTALKLGAKEYLLKPMITKDLYDVLDRLIVTVSLEEQKSQMAQDWSFNRIIRGLNSHNSRIMWNIWQEIGLWSLLYLKIGIVRVHGPGVD